MVSYVVTVALGAAIGLAFVFTLVRAYRKLARIELVALWWWVAIVVLAFGGVAGRVPLMSGLAGVLMIGLGFLLATNRRGIADKLGNRRMGVGPLWTQYSASYWRLSGFFLAVVGAFWTLAFGSAT
jgi:hypothetical protein